jgi:hypothetical protein
VSAQTIMDWLAGRVSPSAVSAGRYRSPQPFPHIPKDVPAKDFWSVVVYDPQTRSELQTSNPFPSKNNKRDKLIVNADGSVDIYSGHGAPAGKEANWIQSVLGKGWFAIFRAPVTGCG